MRIGAAWCVELGRVVDGLQAKAAYFAQPEPRRRFTFLCSNERCRNERAAARVEKLRAEPRPLFPDQPWRTVRDALMGLPDPEREPSSNLANHVFNPGARSYPGHTGSPLDEPAKTLKAGDHGVPGGENMLVRPDGSLRYFTVREAARLQTFPDHYVFRGSWSEAMRQLGNAVPVLLGETVARSVAAALAKSARQ